MSIDNLGVEVAIVTSVVSMMLSLLSMLFVISDRRGGQKEKRQQEREAQMRLHAVKVTITATMGARPYYQFTATNQSKRPIKIIAVEGTIRTTDGQEWNIKFFEGHPMPSIFGNSPEVWRPWWGDAPPFILVSDQSKTASISQVELASYNIDAKLYPEKVILSATYIAEDGTAYFGQSEPLPLVSIASHSSEPSNE